MTRFMAALIAFYLTVGIVQIPYVQALLPQYIQELAAFEEGYGEEYEEDAYFVSIIIPQAGFDPAEEDQEIYSQKLRYVKYEVVAGLLKKLPQVQMEHRDSYTFKLEDVEIPVTLYTDKEENQVSEIEFQLPVSSLDKGEKLVKTLSQLAAQLEGSQLYDYTGKKVYQLKDQAALVKAINQYEE